MNVQLAETQSWYDIDDSDLNPYEVYIWDNIQSTKKILDIYFEDLHKQFFDYKNFDFTDYFVYIRSIIDSITNENIRQTIIQYYNEKIRELALNLNQTYGIIDLNDDITIIENYIKQIYQFVILKFYDICFTIIRNNKKIDVDTFRYHIKKYYDSILESLIRFSKLYKSKEAIVLIQKKINKIGFVKEIVVSNPDIIKFLYKRYKYNFS